MIFVATGHCLPFDRLIKRVDELAIQLDEPVVQQTGEGSPAVNCKSFAYDSSLLSHFQDARLVISHAGVGTTLELLEMGKPVILVPRQRQFAEHYDDHQVETAQKMHERFGLKYVLNVSELTVDLLTDYSYVAPWTDEPLDRFRREVISILRT